LEALREKATKLHSYSRWDSDRTHLGSISLVNGLSISLMKYKLSFAVALVRVCLKFLTKLLC